MIAIRPSNPLNEASMSTVAEQLRVAREAKNLTVNQVAEATKIRTDHIRALEEGNFNVFSAPVYIRGSVKNYGAFLKLDVSQLMAELNSELGQTKKFHEPPPLTDQKRGAMDFITLQLSKLTWRRGMIIGGVLLAMIVIVAVIIFTRNHTPRDPIKGTPPAVYQGGKTSGDTLPLPRQTR